MSQRANALAERIQQGAQAMANFGETLTDAEWQTVVPNEGRTVGILFHHVANVYPMQVDTAEAVAAGHALTGVGWDLVAHLNAQHAQEHVAVGKAETLSLLRQNSQRAAERVRGMTDEQLDHAATYSLHADAPLTAQFVIEDNALRHSFHHLANIRAALER
jgi:hypothetical protein